MPQVEFEGKIHDFPEDVTPEEISKALSTIPKQASWWDTFKAIPGTVIGSAQKAIGGEIQATGESDALTGMGYPIADVIASQTGERREDVEGRLKQGRKDSPVAQTGKGIAESGIINEKEASPGEMTYWQNAALSGVSSAAQMAPLLALSIAGKSPTAAVAGGAALAGGQGYAEARSKGVEPEFAAGHAAIDATVEGVMEMIPASYLIDNLSKPVYRLMLGTLLREVPSEVVTTAIQSANSRAQDAQQTGKPFDWKAYGQDLLDTVGSTMISAPLTAGFGKVANRAIHGPELTAAEAGKKAGEETVEQLKGTIIPDSSPQKPTPTVPLTSAQMTEVDKVITSIDEGLLTDKDVEEAKAVMQAHEEAKKAPPVNPDAVAAWKPLAGTPVTVDSDVSELGTSQKQATNAVNYDNPNKGDRMGRMFSFGPSEAIGLTPSQVIPKAATYTLGVESSDRPRAYLEALHDTVEAWRAKFMPNSTVVISNEQLYTNAALGAYKTLAPGMHLIVPAVLRGFKNSREYNPNTQVSAFYNATHEFGHALVHDRFFDGVDPALQNAIQLDSSLGLISPQHIAAMPPAQQAVLREYNALKQRYISGEFTAQQFIDTWFSPGKLGRKTYLKDLGVAPTAPARDIVKAMARRALANRTMKETSRKAFLESTERELLSVDEYMAEQTARWAYASETDKGTPLGQFFAEALKSLRDFFTSAKRDGYIAPGVAFKEWIEGLSKGEAVIEPVQRAVAAKTKAGKGKVKKSAETSSVSAEPAKPKTPAKKPVKKVERVEHNVDTSTKEGKTARARQLVANLIRSKVIEPNSPEFKELNQLIKQEDWDEFIDLFQVHAGKTVKFELDQVPESDRSNWAPFTVLRSGIPEEQAKNPKVLAEAAQEWKEKQFGSRFFKAWFGDWENDPENASQVMRANNKGPLALFHSTYSNEAGLDQRYVGKRPEVSTEAFKAFKVGDLGFHFGTLRAAHIRAFRGDLNRWAEEEYIAQLFEKESKVLAALEPENTNIKRQSVADGLYVIPVVLNLRNPLDIGEERAAAWNSPVLFADMLLHQGVISDVEHTMLLRTLREDSPVGSYRPTYRYDTFGPIRKILMAKGYDGIRYENVAEGDTSFVAFHPNQVKSLLSSRTFSRSDNMHLELDFDEATPEGQAAAGMLKTIKNYMMDPAPLRRALRRVQHMVFNSLQIQQQAHLAPDLTDLSTFVGFNTQFTLQKGQLMALPDKLAGEWANLGKESFSKVNKFLIDELEGGVLWVDLVKGPKGPNDYIFQGNEVTKQKMLERGIDTNTEEGAQLAKLILEVKNDLLNKLNIKEQVLLGIMAHRYAGDDPRVFRASMVPLKKQIHDLRKVPFFPQGRFGNLMLTIETKKESGGWEVSYKEAFESRAQWEEAWKKADARKKPDERVRGHILTDQQYVLMSIPTNFADLMASELDLSGEQIETMLQIMQPVKQEKLLKAYDRERLGIKGYTSDALRSYVDFSWHDANLIAKLEYRAKFNMTIRNLGQKLKDQQMASPPDAAEVERLTNVKRSMERARDYIMAPPNEAQSLRALVSIAYLWLNVKTASMNLYGLVTTYSAMTTELGLIKGTALLAKATKHTMDSIRLTDLNTRKEGDYLPKEIQEALDKAIEQGVLSQSYAYHLAGMANSGNLYRLPARQTATRYFRKTVDAGMYLFRLTELSTRRITFLANLEAAMAKPEPLETPYDTAVKKTAILQNDYSLGNRVPWMRGISTKDGNRVVEAVVPLATVFMSFAQHMAFHAYGGYELGNRRAAQLAGETPRKVLGGYTMKLWLITLLLAGYEGLPGMENILDLIEAAWRKWGGPKPIRQALREYVQGIESLGMNPQVAAHGFGHNFLGYDVSRSVGFGRFVPGTDALAHPRQTLEAQVGTLLIDMMGATGAFIKFGLEAGYSTKSPKETFEKLPGGLGNIYVAYRWTQQGVRGPNDGLITHDLQTGKLRDLTSAEIAGKALGFNPTVVSQNREVLFAQHDRKMYWQSRRQGLLDNYWEAKWHKDREAIADTKKAVTEFNMTVPPEYSNLRIKGVDLARSLDYKRKQQAAEEKQSTTSRRYAPLYRDVKESYE